MFRRVLVANRGEIAVRVIRTLREMGITSIAAFSDADRDALFVQLADEAYRLGPPPPLESYLDESALLSVAAQAGADAVHPGYGFLSENVRFATRVNEAGMTFIGPSARSIGLMGDKVAARQAVSRAGVPVVPGTTNPVRRLDEALTFAEEVGFPLAVKASGGGGGRGIRVVWETGQLADALQQAQREAEAYFKQPDVYLERYFANPRHVEIQILGDHLGRLVHLGERDCSVQRRYQKLMEESPSPVVDRQLRAEMGEMALRAARAADYSSAGTIEFLLTPEREFFFLEMNTRIQVEHPVTEEVTGVDLIKEMVLVAAGEPITMRDNVSDPRGHAIEVRINAEDAMNDFRPAAGLISRYRPPGGPGIRVDSGVYAGYAVPSNYDSLVSKLISWGPDREAARVRAIRALEEYEIGGIPTTVGFAQSVLHHPLFIAGDINTSFLADHLKDVQDRMRVGRQFTGPDAEVAGRGDERAFEVEVNRKVFRVRVVDLKEKADRATKRRQGSEGRKVGAGSNTLASPMHGTVIAIEKQVGEHVEHGETLFVIEAMKMENEVISHRSGTVQAVHVKLGDTVDSQQPLASIA